MHTETIIIESEFEHTWNQPQRQEPTFSWGIFSDPPWQPPTWPQGWEGGCWWWWPGPPDVETGSMFPHSRGWRGQRPHRSWCSQVSGGRPFHPHSPRSRGYDLCYLTLNMNTIRLSYSYYRWLWRLPPFLFIMSYSCCESYTFDLKEVCKVENCQRVCNLTYLDLQQPTLLDEHQVHHLENGHCSKF